MSEVFEGRSAEMKKNSPWLASEDLIGLGDVKVTIAQCYRHKDVEFEAGRKEAVVYSIEFEGKKKQLVLNSENRQTLVGHFGPNVKDWAGKQIVLYIKPDVKLRGKMVNGIRIR